MNPSNRARDISESLFRIEVLAGAQPTVGFVDQYSFVIGRSKELGFQIDSLGVSREHLEVWIDQGVIWIRDPKSSNGTYVNGQMIPKNTSVSYRSGSEISLGQDVKIRIHCDSLVQDPLKNAISGGRIYAQGYQNTNPGVSAPPNFQGTNPGLSHTNPGFSQTNPGLPQSAPSLNQTNPGISHTNPGVPFPNPQFQQTNPGIQNAYGVSNSQPLGQVVPFPGVQQVPSPPIPNAMDEVFQQFTAAKAAQMISQAEEEGRKLKERALREAEQIVGQAHMSKSQIEMETRSKAIKEIEEKSKEYLANIEAQAQQMKRSSQEQAQLLIQSTKEELQKQQLLARRQREDEDSDWRAQLETLQKSVEALDLQRRVSAQEMEAVGKLRESAIAEKQKIQMEMDELRQRAQTEKLDFDHFKSIVQQETTALNAERERTKSDLDMIHARKEQLAMEESQSRQKRDQAEREFSAFRSEYEQLKVRREQDLSQIQSDIERAELRKKSVENDLTKRQAELLELVEKISRDRSQAENDARRIFEEADRKKKSLEEEGQRIADELYKKADTHYQENREKARLLYKELKERAEGQSEKIVKSSEQGRDKMIATAEAQAKALLEGAKKEADVHEGRKQQALDWIQKRENESNQRIQNLEDSAKKSCEQLVTQAKQQAQDLSKKTQTDASSIRDQAEKYAQTTKDQADRYAQSLKNSVTEEAQAKKKAVEEEIASKKAKLEAEIQTKRAQEQKEYEERRANVEAELVKRKVAIQNEIEHLREKAENEFDQAKARAKTDIIAQLTNLTMAELKAIAPENQMQYETLRSKMERVVNQILGHALDDVAEKMKDHIPFDPEIPRVQRSWPRKLMWVFGVLATVVLSYQFVPGIKEGVVKVLGGKTAEQVFLEQLQQKRIDAIYKPAKSPMFKESYMECVLYTENFATVILGSKFQEVWIRELNRFFLNDLELHEDTIVEFIKLESRLVSDLMEMSREIPKAEKESVLEKMREREADFRLQLSELLKGRQNVERFQGFKKEFYDRNAGALKGQFKVKGRRSQS